MLRLRINKFFIILITLHICLYYSCNTNKPTKKLTIGFAQTGINDQWRKSMIKDMEIEVAFYPNINLKVLDGKDDIENQIKNLEELILEKVDIIIVSPVKSKPITPYVEKALKAGIPVLVVDRKIDGQNYTAYLGGDNEQVGVNVANYISSIAGNDPKKIIEIKGLKGSSPAYDRSISFNKIINKTNNLNIVHSIEGNWEEYSIKDSLKSFLKKEKDINYIYAHNDRMALGAWDVLKELNLDNHVDIIGVDGLNEPNGGIQLVKDNILKATVFYPTGGHEAIKLAIEILNGEKVNKNNTLETILIDSRNADIMKHQFDKIYEHQLDIIKQQEKIKQQEDTYTEQSNTLKIVLALFIISMALGIYSIYSSYNIRKKKRELEIINKKITKQKKEIKKIANEAELSNEAKVNFFTALSHEFKTPITLILSSIESLTEKQSTYKNNLKNEISVIFNNSKRLLRLTNQLLDFRKVEESKFTLKASETNLLDFSKGIFNDFESEARKRNINFTLETNNKDLSIFIDRNLMDKVYFNLLSNAFKFTPNDGDISIKITDHKERNFINVCFKDSGIGIPSDDLNTIFNAFTIASNNTKASSGIGLHLSKEFIELHKGSIDVDSKLGTEFTLKLYKGDTHLKPEEITYQSAVIDQSIITLDNENDDNYFSETSINKNSNTGYSILIIEDNLDLIKYLESKLNINYNVHLSNGIDGIEKALEIIPDLIICDVNLPDKDGYVICEILKNDLRTSHIPIIMLTVLDNEESYLKGLHSGIDSYLTKPFSFSVLSQSIKTLIYNQEKFRYNFLHNVKDINFKKNIATTEQDFILEINEIIKKNRTNSTLSEESIAADLNISKIQLNKKLNAILGISISDYLQIEKDKNALNK